MTAVPPDAPRPAAAPSPASDSSQGSGDDPAPAGSGSAATPVRRAPRPLYLAMVGVTALTYAADQISKIVAVDQLTGADPVQVIPEVLQLRLIRNPRAAFGIGPDDTLFLTAVAAIVVVAILVVARRLGSRLWSVALGLLLGGALGNLTDRFAQPPGGGRGHVVDFLELPNWPIFNLADSSIVCGAALIAVLGIRGIGLDGRREPRRPKDEAGESPTAAVPE